MESVEIRKRKQAKVSIRKKKAWRAVFQLKGKAKRKGVGDDLEGRSEIQRVQECNDDG